LDNCEIYAFIKPIVRSLSSGMTGLRACVIGVTCFWAPSGPAHVGCAIGVRFAPAQQLASASPHPRLVQPRSLHSQRLLLLAAASSPCCSLLRPAAAFLLRRSLFASHQLGTILLVCSEHGACLARPRPWNARLKCMCQARPRSIACVMLRSEDMLPGIKCRR
jgi:hypothetical protein